MSTADAKQGLENLDCSQQEPEGFSGGAEVQAHLQLRVLVLVQGHRAIPTKPVGSAGQ